MMINKTKLAPKVTLDELVNVLSFYADKENYFGDLNNNIKTDNGKQARKILKKLVKEYLDREGIKNNL